MDNKGRCKLLGNATNGSYNDLVETPFANLWTTAHCHEQQSIILGDIGLHRVIRLLIWLWSFLLVFSVNEGSLMCLFHACKTNWEIVWKSFTLGAGKSASIVRVVNPEKCNLFESSMLSSPSILVSLSMLQGSCNLTQTLFIWWLWTCTKSRCHTWPQEFSQMRCNGGYLIFK